MHIIFWVNLQDREFLTIIVSNFEVRFLTIDWSKIQCVTYHFVVYFLFFLKHWGELWWFSLWEALRPVQANIVSSHIIRSPHLKDTYLFSLVTHFREFHKLGKIAKNWRAQVLISRIYSLISMIEFEMTFFFLSGSL